MPRTTRTWTIATLLLIALAGSWVVRPAPAEAGTYVVHSCGDDRGGLLSTSAWEFHTMWSTGGFENTCPRGGMRELLRPGVVHRADAWTRIMFEAPSSTQIVQYRIWRSAVVQAGETGDYWFSGREKTAGTWNWAGPGCKGRNGCSRIGDPAKGRTDVNKWEAKPALPIAGVDLYISCGLDNGSTTGCPAANPAAEAWLHGAEITLADDVAPAFDTPPTGTLVESPAPLKGAVPVSIQASDRGGGLRRARVEIDGVEVASQPLGSTPCAEPYTARVPCPLRAAHTFLVDTARVPDGPHQVRIMLDDLAGNTTVSEPRPITTQNAPPDRGCEVPFVGTGPLAMTTRLSIATKRKKGKTKALSRTKVTLAYRTRRKISVAGRLSAPGGTPVAGAPVCVVGRTLGSQGAAQPLARLTTDADGRFSAPIGRGPSRELWAIHRSGDNAIAGRVLLRVKPRVTLRPSRRRLRNGQLLTLRGSVSGGPIPSRGVIVHAEAWRGTRWQAFGKARARGSKGRFRIRYRFAGTRGTQRYTLRVTVAAQAAYPYSAGRSKRIHVRVRG